MNPADGRVSLTWIRSVLCKRAAHTKQARRVQVLRRSDHGEHSGPTGRRGRPERLREVEHHRRGPVGSRGVARLDRKSTRLNSSHVEISYAVFCLKKKKRPIAPGTLFS